MKTPIRHRIIFGILTGLLSCLPLIANAAFITDKIIAEIRTERFDQGTVLKELSSGASVEVLMSDGKYSRVRTTDNITGWVNSKFLTNEKPNQLEHLELLSKIKATEKKLRSAEEKLANAPAAGSDSINNKKIESLKKQVKDAQWMKAEMQKARSRAEKAEEKLKAELKKQSSKGKQNNDTQQQLEDLHTQNNELETRLAAALLINEQQLAPTTEPTPITLVATTADGWTVNLQWFFGSLFVTLIIGFFAGLTWLDKRIRRRHGGFRIY